MRRGLLRLLSFAAVIAFTFSSLSINSYALDFRDYTGEKTVLAEPDDSWNKITISSASDFVALAELCRLDNNSGKVYAELASDISFSGEKFVPIPYFKGIFNGNGYTISGVTCLNTTEPVGLFSTIGRGGTVYNLKVTGALQPNENCNYIGAVAGENNGIIYKCSFEGVVTGNNYVGGIAGLNGSNGKIVNCKVSGAVRGDNMVGGIAGTNEGAIIGCENNAYINTESVDGGIDIASLDLEFTLDLAKLKSQNNTYMQDMGGIAGYSCGTVYLSVNKGEIGYNHQGYNVGGIIGRSSGYVFECTNYAYVCGRKDIGGIVGQMEPYVQITETESTFTTLNNQIKEMQDLLELTRDHAYNAGNNASAHIDSILEKFDDVQGNASDISDILTDSGEKGKDQSAEEKADQTVQFIKDNADTTGLDKNSIDKKKDEVDKNQDELDESLTDISNELKELNESARGYSKELDRDLDRINEKYNEINDTIVSIKDISFEVQDTSSIDPDSIVLGAVKGCTNEASIEGDLNTGGIVGVMGEESSIDPEEEISLSIDLETHKNYEYKAVLINCVNKGDIRIKRNYAGGIVARAEIGFIRNCENYGHVYAEGNYVGGIAAEAGIKIENCYVKATLSGVKHVGGIAGSGVNQTANGEGSTISNSRALVAIDGATKFYGAIAGSADGSYENNTFSSDTLLGLGAYSADGQAYCVSYDELMSGEDVPEAFTRLYVKFIAGDSVLETREVKYGTGIKSDDYPSIPQKSGCFAKWDIREISAVSSDTDITAVYCDYIESIASEDARMSGRPVFYAEGDFTDSDKLTVIKGENSSLPIGENGSGIYDSRFYKRDIEERWQIVLPNDGREIHSVRYLPTGISSKAPEIYVKENGVYRLAELTEIGSYYAFDTSCEEIEITVVTTMPVYYTFVMTGVIIAAAIVVLILVISISRKVIKKAGSRKKKAGETDAEKTGEADESDEITVVGKSENHENRVMPLNEEKTVSRKKNVIKIFFGIFNFVFAVAVIIATVYLANNPQIVNERIAHFIALRMAESSNLSFDADVTFKAGDNEWNTHSFVRSVRNGEDLYTIIESSGAVLYKHDNRIYLESGKAFEVSEIIPDYAKVYDIIPELISGSGITAERVDGGTKRTFTIEGLDAENIVSQVAGEYYDRIESTESVQVIILTANRKIRSLAVKTGLTLKDGQKASLECVLTGKEVSEEINIPEKVLSAVANPGESVKITPEILDLLWAYGKFNALNPAVCDITLTARGGVLTLESGFSWFRCREDGDWINCVSKNGVSFYYNNNGACTAKGVSLSDTQKETVDMARLIDTAYDLVCTNDIIAVDEGDRTAYRLELDAGEMERLLGIMTPEMSTVDKILSSGTVSVVVKNNEIAEIGVNVSGNVPLKMITKVFSVSVKAVPVSIKSDSDYSIPQEVLEVLTHK